MQGFEIEKLLQALVGIGTAGVALGAILTGFRKGPAAPPEQRAPSPHEVKAALADMRALIERRGSDTDDNITDLARQMDRIERMVERLGDRMDNESRIGAALARLSRTD